MWAQVQFRNLHTVLGLVYSASTKSLQRTAVALCSSCRLRMSIPARQCLATRRTTIAVPMGDQTKTRTHVRRAQCSFGGKIAEVRDGTMLISQSASCATFPSICHNNMRPNRSVNPAKRRRPGDARRFEEEMSSMNLSDSPDREIQIMSVGRR